jgi:hypothetical protein
MRAKCPVSHSRVSCFQILTSAFCAQNTMSLCFPISIRNQYKTGSTYLEKRWVTKSFLTEL